MGKGFFGTNRPFTAGDDGLFLGIGRPLVGAANALRIVINRESAIDNISVLVDNPEWEFRKKELESVEIELENEKERFKELEELPFGERLERIGIDPSELGPLEFINPLDRSADRIHELQGTKEDLEERLAETSRQITSETARPSDVEGVLQEQIEEALLGTGISKGPFVNDNGENVVVVASYVGLNERKREEVRNMLQKEGYNVERIEAFEI